MRRRETEEGEAAQCACLDGRRELDSCGNKIDAESRGSKGQSVIQPGYQCQIIHIRPDAEYCYEPPEQSGDIVPYEGIISWAGLYIACRIEEGGQRHAKERIRIVYHLLVFQASRQAKVAHMECLRYGRPDKLDKATEHGES